MLIKGNATCRRPGPHLTKESSGQKPVVKSRSPIANFLFARGSNLIKRPSDRAVFRWDIVVEQCNLGPQSHVED